MVSPAPSGDSQFESGSEAAQEAAVSHVIALLKAGKLTDKQREGLEEALKTVLSGPAENDDPKAVIRDEAAGEVKSVLVDSPLEHTKAQMLMDLKRDIEELEWATINLEKAIREGRREYYEAFVGELVTNYLDTDGNSQFSDSDLFKRLGNVAYSVFGARFIYPAPGDRYDQSVHSMHSYDTARYYGRKEGEVLFVKAIGFSYADRLEKAEVVYGE